jgi:LPXTG-motif cell wall-anchored protein
MRLRVCALFAIAFVALAALALPAAADVQPTGTNKLTIKLTNKLVIFEEMTTLVSEGTATATIAADGTFTIPKASVKLSSVKDLSFLDGGVHVSEIKFAAAADWNGAVDPESGLVSVAAPITFTTSGDSPIPVPGCPITITVNLSSSKAGGKKYDATTGKVTLGANDYGIPALPYDPNASETVPGCGGAEAVFNSALMLPLAPGGASTVAQVTFDPTVEGVGVTTPVTNATTTTTAPPATVVPASTVPATVAPAATDELPRTGSSTLPLALAGGVCLLAGLALVASKRRVA